MSDFAVPLVVQIQHFVARASITASAVRSQGTSGVKDAATAYLARLPLSDFALCDAKSFRDALDNETEALQLALPRDARPWGLARKCLNMFLRDAYYNADLRETYHLSAAVAHYEVPLDGIVARGLKATAGRGTLPAWPGVKHLKAQIRDRFQEFASSCAADNGIARVHIDAFLWTTGRR